MIRTTLCLLGALLTARMLHAAEPPVTIIIDGKEYHEGDELPLAGSGYGALSAGSGFNTFVAGDSHVDPPPEPVLTAEAQRLKEVKASVFGKTTRGDVSNITVGAENLGTIKLERMPRGENVPNQAQREYWLQFAREHGMYEIDPEKAEFTADRMAGGAEVMQQEAQEKLPQFLRANAAIVGDAGDYNYVVVSASPKDILFRQVINGIEMPNSNILLDDDNRVVYLQLYVTKPGNPDFNRSTWLAENELKARTIAVITSELGGFDASGISDSEYQITFHIPEGDPEAAMQPYLVPVYATIYEGTLIELNVLTGELVNIGSISRD